MRLCVYNATHLASAMEINKFISAALGLVRFFIPDFRDKGDASNINKPQHAANGGCMATKVLVKECQYAEFKQSWQDEYLKWICAFANTEGGSLFVGVDDKGYALFMQGRTWDSVPVPGISTKELDHGALKLFREKAVESQRLDKKAAGVSVQNLLQNLRCTEGSHLTRAAMMCFHPDPESWVTGAYIKIGFFATEADILYQDEIHGPLLIQVERAMDLIFTKYMKALVSYEGINRQERFFFPPDAFRELLLNAVVHKDYTETTPIQIKIYSDRIWMWNPGNMPEEVKVKDLFKKHVSKPRNPNIANVFFKSGYVESWGRGYYNIELACEETDSKLPKPKAEFGGLTVECRASDQYKELASKWNIGGANLPINLPINPPINPPINKTQQVLLDLIKESNSYTYDNLASLTNKHRDTVRENLKKLQELGLIRRVGARKNGHWEIVEK